MEIIDTFVTRSQAARKAARLDLKSFNVVRLGNDGYRLSSMSDHPGIDAAREYAKACDWINHIETHYVDEGRTPGTKLVFVVTCFRDEIPADEMMDGVDVMPITESLWGDDKEAFSHRARAPKPSGEPRAKSDVESPTKLVWKIADEFGKAAMLLTKEDRAVIVSRCVEQGVNESTAKTQVYRWAKARSE